MYQLNPVEYQSIINILRGKEQTIDQFSTLKLRAAQEQALTTFDKAIKELNK